MGLLFDSGQEIGRKRLHPCGCVLWLCVLWLAGPVGAETIHLESGESVEGKVTEETDNHIKLDVGIGMDVTYFKSQIKSREGQPADLSDDEDDDAFPTENNAEDEGNPPKVNEYHNAREEFKAISPEQDKAIDQILRERKISGDQAALMETIRLNQTALDLFEEATLQENSGDLFGAKARFVEDPSSITEYQYALDLLRFLLVESLDDLTVSNVASSERKLITALRFLQDLAQQKHALAQLIHVEYLAQQYIIPLMTDRLLASEHEREFYLKFLTLTSEVIDQHFSLEKYVHEERALELGRVKLLASEIPSKEGQPGDVAEHQLKILFKQKTRDLHRLRLKTAQTNQPEFYKVKAEQVHQELEKSLAGFSGDGGANLPPEFHVNQWILAIMPKDYSKVYDEYYEMLTRYKILLVSAALKLYVIDNGRYPGNLDDLVPKYLPEAPTDPFNDFQPINYVQKDGRHVLYSYGPDRKDQEGRQNLDDIELVRHHYAQRPGDIVFEF